MASRNGTLAWLFVAVVPAFAVTGTVTRLYRDHEHALAEAWVQRADRATQAGDHEDAVRALQSALRFAPDAREHMFALARALMAAGRPSEARAYLRSLWESEPGSGRVNIELGRIAAAEGDTTAAIRYYHNAVEGSWRAEAERQRRAARLELARYLIAKGERTRAQAELLPLTSDPPEDPDAVAVVGHLLIEAGAPGAARVLFEAGLRGERRHAALLEGAGEAAFRVGDYAAAHSYFLRARAQGVSPGLNAAVAAEVLRSDPFQPRLSTRERARRARLAIDRAIERAAGCAGVDAAAREALDALRPRVTDAALRRDPEFIEEAVERAYRVAASVSVACNADTPIDHALRLIAERRFGP